MGTKKPPTAKTTAAHVLAINQDAVVKALAEVKLKTNAAIDDVANLVLKETGVLKDVQEAIIVAKATLQELHGIDAETASIAALQLEKEAQKQSWAREREEFEYSLRIEKRNKSEALRTELEGLADEMREKMATEAIAIDQRRATLEADVKAFAADKTRLEKVAADAEASEKRAVAIATNSLKKDLEHAHSIEKLNLSNDKAMLMKEVNDLKGRVADLTKANADLQKVADDANKRVQDIANEAIRGAAGSKVTVQTAQPTEQPRTR